MATQERYIKLAQTLPPKLLQYFARHPPSLAATTTQASSIAGVLITGISNAAAITDTTVSAVPELPKFRSNPFLVRKSPTGALQDARYSLRRQADLVKLARQHGVEDLLPSSSKKPEVKLRKREEHGLRVKGTGVGQKVKGHWRERTLKGRLEKRRNAMLGMPQLVKDWREKGHGRYWKSWPK